MPKWPLKLTRLPRLQIFSAVSALAVTAFCMILSGKLEPPVPAWPFKPTILRCHSKLSFLFLHYSVMPFPLHNCKSILSRQWYFSLCANKILPLYIVNLIWFNLLILFKVNIYWHPQIIHFNQLKRLFKFCGSKNSNMSLYLQWPIWNLRDVWIL